MMNAQRVVLVVSVAALFVFSSWGPAEGGEGEMFDIPSVSGMYQASDFQPEHGEKPEEWDWPSRGLFHDEWQWHQRHVTAMEVIVGELNFEPSDDSARRDCPSAAHSFDNALMGIETVRLVNLFPIQPPHPDDEARFQRFLQSIGPLEQIRGADDESDGGEIVYRNTCGKVSIAPVHIGRAQDPRGEELVDRVYAVTLLESGDDLYEMAPTEATAPPPEEAIRQQLRDGDREQRRDAVEKLLASHLGTGSPLWGEALEQLDDKDDELARRIHRRYRPSGVESTDVAENYARVCKRLGDTGCFLKIRLRIMKDSGSCGADSPERGINGCSGASAFEAAPIDVGRFFRGLALEYQMHGERSRLMELQPLARALANGPQRLVDRFVAMAEDPELDEMNRLNAVRIVYYSAVAGEETNRERLERLQQADLPPTARHFLDWQDRLDD